jgi:hypothetical protein
MELCVVIQAEALESGQNGGEFIMDGSSTSHNLELHITLSSIIENGGCPGIESHAGLVSPWC